MISSQLAFSSSNAPSVSDIEQSRTSYISPQPGWDTGQNIVFTIPPRGTEYLSSVLTLEARFSVRHQDNSPLTAAEEAAFTNLPIASFFQTAKLTIGDTVVEGTAVYFVVLSASSNNTSLSGLNTNWQFRTWMSSIMTLPITAKGYYAQDLYKNIPDSPYYTQSRIEAENTGYWTRKLLTGNSQKNMMLVPIPFSFCSAGLAIPPGHVCDGMCHICDGQREVCSASVEMKKLVLGSSHPLRLRVNYLSLSPTSEARLLHNHSLHYPYYKVDLTNVTTIPDGIQNITIEVARGQIPQLFLFGFIVTSMTQSNYQVNYQNLSATRVQSLQAVCNGRAFPANPYNFTWTAQEGTYEAYELFIQTCKLLGGDSSTTYAEWAGGRCLIPIVIGDYMPSLQYKSPSLEGLLSLNIRFSDPLANPINFYSLAVSPTQLSISKDGAVTVPP